MNGLGMPNGYFCMKLAIKKAKQTGVGWVIVGALCARFAS